VYLQVGYELLYDCPQPTPMILMLNIHSARASDIVVRDRLITNPAFLSRPTTMALATGAAGLWCRRDNFGSPPMRWWTRGRPTWSRLWTSSTQCKTFLKNAVFEQCEELSIHGKKRPAFATQR
jgi:hypothetical protein